MSKWDRFRALRKGGPHGPTQEIFKCTGCNAETVVGDNWRADPNEHKCSPGCQCQAGDWFEREKPEGYRRNFDRIFPESPGAGL